MDLELKVYLRERKLLVALLVIEVVRVLLFAMTNYNLEFFNWLKMGQGIIYRPGAFFGVYQAPAYIFAAEYVMWLVLTHNLNPPLGTLALENLAFTLFMKMTFLISEVATILLIIHIVRKSTNSPRRALGAAMLWITSPLVFLCETHSPVDILPALLILLGVYAIHRSRVKFGSVSFAIGSVLRLAPLLVTWIYVVAFARLRQFKNLIGFLGIQLTLFACGILYIQYVFGHSAFQVLEGSGYPGVFIPEIVSGLSAAVNPGIAYNPVQLNLGVIVFILVGYIVTRPSMWNRRVSGVEALAFFAAYFALVFQDSFILWMLPLLFVYASITKYGPIRLLLTTILGFLYVLVSDSNYYTSEGAAVLLVPNLNQMMSTLSSALRLLGGSASPLTPFFRSLFSASLVLIIFWILRDNSN
jgi:hypothetical protein